MIAAIQGLKAIEPGSTITIYSDSQYLVNGITNWIFKWKRNKFKGKKNVDLWKELDYHQSQHDVQWIWIRSHNSDYFNSMADRYAKFCSNNGDNS